MINKSKQDWSVGATVKVGFLTLEVKAAVPTPGDYAPDAYILVNKAQTQLYSFVPHNGITKISVSEAQEMISEAQAYAARVAAQVIAKAANTRAISALSI
jgi:hypothetical protein